MDCNCQCKKTLQKSKEFLKLAQNNRVAKVACNSNSQSEFTPFAMVMEPFKVTVEEYNKLQKMSYLWQKITHLASGDSQLIIKSLQDLKCDPMIGSMLKIYMKKIAQDQQKGRTQDLKPKIELFRTDFFITDDEKDNIKLIEYNNISVSMAGISQKFNIAQKELWGNEKKIIDNNCTEVYAKGLVNFYREAKLEGIMIAVVQEKQTNKVDQDLLFEAIKKLSKIEIVRIFLKDLNLLIKLNESGDLIYDDKKVALVYYRAGYSSKQNIEWASIQKCNLSTAVNIPSISSYLIGTKKMQAVLSKKEIMRKFLTQEQSNLLVQSVIETWDFESENSKEQAIKLMEEQGIDKFVLKPNEEGGKNNLFGREAYQKIKELSKDQLLNYILTRRIKSRLQKCNIVSSSGWDQPKICSCPIESEVSIYGCVCSGGCCCQSQKGCKCNTNCIVNFCGGYLVRSKPQGVNEGGLMAGTGAICCLELDS